MTAPDHTTKPLENILRERGHPYMGMLGVPMIDGDPIDLGPKIAREGAKVGKLHGVVQ